MEETLACFCNACSNELGQFRNLWSVIGNNYYTPVYPILSYGHGFIGTGDVRASKLGELKTCFLQNLNCKYCHVFLGVRCDSAPNGHILQKHQLLLRLSEITTLVAGTNQKAQISVKNSFILESADSTAAKKSKSRAPSIAPGPSRSKSMSVQPTHSRPSQSSQPLQSLQPVQGIRAPKPSQPLQSSTVKHSDAMPPPPVPASKEDILSDLLVTATPSGFEVWAEKEIKDQRKDITRISGTVDRIEKTMDDIKAFMEEVRGQRATDREHQNEAASSRQTLHTALSNVEQRMTSVEQRNMQNLNDIELLTADSATKENVSHLATLVESIGHREVDDISALKEEFRIMSARIGSTSEAGWEALRNELNTLKTKVMVLEASTKKMRSDAATAESSRVRNEVAMQKRISELPASSRTEVIPMQRALELAGDFSLYSSPYGPSRPTKAPPNTMPRPASYGSPYSAAPHAPKYGVSAPSYAPPDSMRSSRPNDGRFTTQPGNGNFGQIHAQHSREPASVNNREGNGPSRGVQSKPNSLLSLKAYQPPKKARSNKRIEVSMQQALKLAGMADHTSSLPTQTTHEREASSMQSIYDKRETGAGLLEPSTNAVIDSVEPAYRQELVAANKDDYSVQEMAPVEKLPRGETIPVQNTPRTEKPTIKPPTEFKKSIIRVEISPIKMDQFPPIKKPEPINLAALSSPDQSDAESSDASSIPAVVKRKRTEPLSDHRGKGKAISPLNESQAKRRKVSVIEAASNDVTPQLESPEPETRHELVDISSSDDDRTSPDAFVNDKAIQSIEAHETESRAPPLDHGAQNLLSMLNKVAKQPFRRSFDTNAPLNTSTAIPKTQQTIVPIGNRTSQLGRVESLYDQNPILNFRTRALEQTVTSAKPADANGNVSRPNGEVDKSSSRQRTSSVQGNDSSSSGSKERRKMPSGPAAGASIERIRSHLQDFTAPTPPTLKSRKALVQAAREEAAFDTSTGRGQEEVIHSSHNNIRQQVQQEQPIATPEQIENPFKCGVCNRRFNKSAALKNHKNYNPVCKADDSRDEMPNEFICSGCEQSFTSLQFFNKHQCKSFANQVEKAGAWISDARKIVEEEERRKRLIRDRDLTAKQILERGMNWK